MKSVYVQTCIMFMKSNHVGQVRQKPKCLTLRCPTQRGVGIIKLFKAVYAGPPGGFLFLRKSRGTLLLIKAEMPI